MIGGDPGFERWVGGGRLSSRRALGLDLPLDVRGTAFQQRVWQALRKDPRRLDATYSQSRSASRAESRAPVAARLRHQRDRRAIPCHRVVRNDGCLRVPWGVRAKRAARA